MIPKTHQQFTRQLEDEIGPLLKRLALNNTRVIWLNQYPSIDFDFRLDKRYSLIYTQIIHHYNLIARRIFRLVNPNQFNSFNFIQYLFCRGSKVVIWDSGDPFAEEYIRACHLLRRHDLQIGRGYKSVFNCYDFIHTGQAALSQTTQILINSLCNKIE